MNTLYDHEGHRKYLTPAERGAFLKAADESEVREVRTFCAALACKAGYDVLIIVDKNMPHQQNLSGRRTSVSVLDGVAALALTTS